jgi:hypothetical protein
LLRLFDAEKSIAKIIPMKKDWKGSPSAVFANLGASNHFDSVRQSEDYYATEPKAVEMLLKIENFNGVIWECACGEGHISKEMKRLGHEVVSSDLINRGYGDGQYDFLGAENNEVLEINIITNPPYKYANEFIKKGMEILESGYKMAMLLPIRYLEGKQRKQIFKQFPPKKVYVSSSRIKCAKNGEFDKMEGSAMSYAWFVWQKGFKGKPTLEWFN